MVLSIGKLTFGNQAYYLKDMYYLRHEEESGQWHGEGAKEVGLSGKVKRRQLSRLFQGKDPFTNKPWVQNAGKRTGKRKRNPGCDYTFSDPKDYSLLVALSPSPIRQTALECRDTAFEETVKKMQQDLGYCRVGTDGIGRVPAKLFLARLTHYTSRLWDCNWHDHCLIANLAWCPDGKVRALDTRLLYKPGYLKELETYRLGILAKELQKHLPIVCVADAVTGVENRFPPNVFDCIAFLLKELVFAPRGDQDESLVVSQILDVGQALHLSAGPSPLADRDVVFLDQLLIDEHGVLVIRNRSGDIEAVSVIHVRYGELLNESILRCA